MIAHYGLGFSAGLLSLLAPCVLPLIPIVFRGASESSKWGPIANALGLTLSFTIVGVLTSLFSSVFDVDVIQKAGAVILILAGLVFLFPGLKSKMTELFSGLSHAGGNLQSRIKSKGVASEFLMGGILGMVWGPCSGPTLAFAFGIATQADQALHATLIFFFFGLGAGVGLVALGLLLKRSRSLIGKFMKFNHVLNVTAGLVSVALGLVILTGQLPLLEEGILSLLPQWLVQLSVSV